ncbi:MAG: hypothetical protein JWM10_1032 [Myxococcaceae bacterium]|nr:hypothetical protein [Myxococcaceae bacterium]
MARLRALILSSLCVAGLASACDSSDTPDDAATDVPVATDVGNDVPATDVPRADAGNDVPAVDVPRVDAGTDVPAIDVPAADVPSSDVPAADVPSSDVPAADVPTTDVPATDVPATDVPAADAGSETVFEATLSGAQEVPSVSSAATGTATVTLNAARTAITYVVRHTLAGATAAHIHTGAPGATGAVIIPFASATSEITGTATLTAAQVTELEAGGLYVNVHSAANPGGEIRGQILRHNEELYLAPLTGDQEVPRVASAATGASSVIFNPATSTIHYRLSTTLTPSAAHIHRGIAGVAGPVVYPFAPLGAAIDGTQAVNATDITELRGGRFYVNVHTAANANGELRGQLLAPGAQLFVSNLTGAQEVPPVTTTSTGTAMVVLNYARTSVSVALSTTATPTAAHLHRGAGAINGPVVVPLALTAGFYTATMDVAPADAALIETGGFYANVHTAANAGGEVRGQVLRPAEVLYTAQLTGAAEVPPVTTSATGSVAMILSPGGNLLRYTGALAAITPTAAHIHAGAVGVAGGVVYPLSFTATSLGGVQAVTSTDVTRLNEGGYYVNVHTAANANGELRGQLARR